MRFNKSAYRKETRSYQENRPENPGLGGPVLALMPKRYWRKP